MVTHVWNAVEASHAAGNVIDFLIATPLATAFVHMPRDNSKITKMWRHAAAIFHFSSESN